MSYDPGEQAAIHVHTTASSYDLRVVRDGAEPVIMLRLDDLPGQAHPTPADCYATGCGWPAALRIPVDEAGPRASTWSSPGSPTSTAAGTSVSTSSSSGRPGPSRGPR